MDQVFEQAARAFAVYKNIPGSERGRLLRAIADEIELLGEELLLLASRESHLPLARLTGERGRTVSQLRLFAGLVEEGAWAEPTIDTALPDRQPLPRPDLRRVLVPLGPVVVFGASNFPLAFSTAGGDTASALAAGCPVIYKEHPAHPQTSQLVAQAISRALQTGGLPAAVFQHLSGGVELGQQLVQHSGAKAVAFTGSFKAGKALFDLACRRPQPIPVFAEMGSVNPIFVLPDLASQQPATLAAQAAASVLLGVGQFCTCPGLVFYPEQDSTDVFLEELAGRLSEAAGAHMLHEGICDNYFTGVKKMLSHQAIASLVSPEADVLEGRAALAKTTLAQWLQHPDLQEEVFGPFVLVVTYQANEDLVAAAAALQGQLTCTLWGSEIDLAAAGSLVDQLREKCGRLLLGGVPTGVEVSPAMTHGGPFTATTDSRSTSVGTYAIKRFARPVTFQGAPQHLLPEVLRNENPRQVWRLINGQLSQESL
ncbi:MAG: aldehyde dehydrogenase (NADP(+)) [Adhaeribacter sp.]